jgi:peptide alpha-N-acetyltransferase
MLRDIKTLVSRDLSEPYSVFTYRYFLHNWPSLCICAYSKNAETGERESLIATIVCKLEEVNDTSQGYIAMLAVDTPFRKSGIGMKLVTMGIERMIRLGCKEVILETEVRFQSFLF